MTKTSGTAHVPHLTRLTEHISCIENKTNIGIITYTESSGKTAVFFIDTGNDAETAKAELSLIKETWGDVSVKAVITTHSHADHCGGNSFLKKETGCEIWATKGEAALMEVPVLQSSLVYGGSPIKEIKSPYLMAEPCPVDRIFFCAEEVALGENLFMRAVSLPGHYIDMAAILVEDRNAGKTAAFLADGISGRNVIKRYWIQYLYDEELFKQSLFRIKDIAADFYIPGHGDMVTDIEGLVELNMIAVLETEAMILDELVTPLTFEEVLAAVAARNSISLKVSQYELIGSTIRSYLSSMQAAGKICYTVENNRMLWKRI
ncbi:MAG: MBL fold metallo-hydrolase [Treponema sp.]|nr:MBL fold metallo-hydrolase [Treponema sp.]